MIGNDSELKADRCLSPSCSLRSCSFTCCLSSAWIVFALDSLTLDQKGKRPNKWHNKTHGTFLRRIQGEEGARGLGGPSKMLIFQIIIGKGSQLHSINDTQAKFLQSFHSGTKNLDTK
jgi:hypothetical protein